MLKLTICVGSSCSVHGADDLAEALEALIARENLHGRLELVGAFCMEQCSSGVSLRVGDTQYREIRPKDVEDFFYTEVYPRLSDEGPEDGEEQCKDG